MSLIWLYIVHQMQLSLLSMSLFSAELNSLQVTSCTTFSTLTLQKFGLVIEFFLTSKVVPYSMHVHTRGGIQSGEVENRNLEIKSALSMR